MSSYDTTGRIETRARGEGTLMVARTKCVRIIGAGNSNIQESLINRSVGVNVDYGH